MLDRAGSAKAAEETWASATRMPRSAETPQNFCLKKPERCAFLRKKFKGMLTDLGNSGKRSHDCPGFLYAVSFQSELSGGERGSVLSNSSNVLSRYDISDSGRFAVLT